MTNTNDLREVAACTYFRARRMARLVTRFYDNQLGSVGINTNQLGLLAKLLDASMLGVSGLSVGALAERVGMHPSTLTRDLKPLMKQGLVQDGNDPEDRRIRMVLITKKAWENCGTPSRHGGVRKSACKMCLATSSCFR